MPGMPDLSLHFTPTKIGKIRNRMLMQLCGLGHYNMKAFLYVMSEEDYQNWLREGGRPAVTARTIRLGGTRQPFEASTMARYAGGQLLTHQHTRPTGFVRKYIFSLDHKVIGKQYYFPGLVFGPFLG